jgi:hypothetical protein
MARIARLRSQLPNAFGLQLNANDNISNPAVQALCTGSADKSICVGWQQFIFSNTSCTPSHTCVDIQNWILHYNSPTCPNGWTSWANGTEPNGTHRIDCVMNAQGAALPTQTISSLGQFKVTASAQAGGDDVLTVTVGSDAAASRQSDSVLNLAQSWTAAEFNVFGDGCGAASVANFNSGSTLVVRIAVDDGTIRAPSCSAHGTTAEQNNLSFATQPNVSTTGSPAMVFTESTGGSALTPCDAVTSIGAGQYTCTFFQNASQVGSCTLNSSNPMQICQSPFSGTNVSAVCAVYPYGSNPPSDFLGCGFTTNPPMSVFDLPTSLNQHNWQDFVKRLDQQPGFKAGSVSIVPVPNGNILSQYIEAQGAPERDAWCK